MDIFIQVYWYWGSLTKSWTKHSRVGWVQAKEIWEDGNI